MNLQRKRTKFMEEIAEQKREPLHKRRLANQQTAEFYADGNFVTRITTVITTNIMDNNNHNTTDKI